MHFIARIFQLFLPSSTRVELCLPTPRALSSELLIIFSPHGEIPPPGPTLLFLRVHSSVIVAFESHHYVPYATPVKNLLGSLLHLARQELLCKTGCVPHYFQYKRDHIIIPPPKYHSQILLCVSFEISRYYYSLRPWGGALLAWYENRGTGRCFSFPTMMLVPESFPPPSDWSGL